MTPLRPPYSASRDQPRRGNFCYRSSNISTTPVVFTVVAENSLPTQTRHQAICDAVVSLLASSGVRGLTHRGVDRAAGVPTGTVSHCAPTKAALLTLAADQIEERLAFPSLGHCAAPKSLSELADAVEGLLDQLGRHVETLRARYALLADAGSKDFHRRLSVDLALRKDAASWCETQLSSLGFASPPVTSKSLVDLCDGLLWLTIFASSNSDIRIVITAFLQGSEHFKDNQSTETGR